MSATTNLLQKLGPLAVLVVLDLWKFFLSFKNLIKTQTYYDVPPEMIAMNEDVGGVAKLSRVASFTFISNVLEIGIISYISIDRTMRIAFKRNAFKWEEITEDEESFISAFVDYTKEVFLYYKTPIIIARFISLVFVDCRHVRRKVLLLREIIENVLVSSWINILAGLADNAKVNEWFFFAVGIISAVQGYVLWRVVLAFDEAFFYMRLEDRIINDYASVMWHFPSKNLKLCNNHDYEVKYMGVVGHHSILIDLNVLTSLPKEQVCCLVALELGQWEYRHSLFNYVFPTLKAVGLGFFLMKSYDNPWVNNLFGFEEAPDPTVPMFIAYMWIWPYAMDVLNYIDALVTCWTILWGDKAALKNHKLADLTAALYHVAGSTEHYPIHDGFYSMWILARPRVQTRIRRLTSAGGNQLTS